MKKSLFIIGLALAALTVSCSKDVELQPAVGGKVTLGVAIESETRTALGALNGGKYDVVWSEGDCLAVNGTKSEPVDAAYVGKKTASFTLSGVEAPYNVLYPASILGKDGNITVPTVQNYTEGSFAAGSAVAVGYTTGSAVTLKNLYSFVKLTIAKGDDVALKSVALQTVGGQAISGVYSVDYQNAEISAIAGQSVIRIMDVPYGADNKAVVYIAVPAGKYEGGFTVTVTGADGKCMTKKASKITDVPAGYIVSMPEFTYTGTARSEVVITSAAELVEFAKVYNSGFDGVALLGNDIDMTGAEELPYFSLLEGALFDGQGYAIKNWTSNHGLINVNYGTVKNLTIDQSCNLTFDMSNTDAHTPHAVVVAENLGVVSGCVNNANITVEAGDVTKNRYVGSIVGLLAVSNDGKVKNINARVENCINNGKIKLTLNSYTGGWFFAGGIVGSYYEYKTFGEGGLFNCVNNGNLEVNVGTMGQKSAVGGLIGGAGALEQAAAFCTIKDCVNNGAVTYNITTVNNNSYIGGIAGSCAAHVVNTTNNGDVTVTVPELGQIWFRTGGVVGDFAGNLTNVHNSGKVKVSLTTQAGKKATPQIGGVAAFHKGSTVAITNSTNSGEVNVATSLASNLFVGGILAQYSSKEVTMTGCENSGNITTVNTAYTSGTGSRVWTAGIVADSKADTTIEGCVNRGAISLSGDLTKESSVGGLAATNYCTFNNCKSLGNLHIEDTSELAEYVLIAGIGCRQGATTTWNGGEVNCAITYEGANVVCGILQGKFWGSTTVGETTPLVIKSTTTINGVAVTADDVANHAKLVAFDEGIKKEDENGVATKVPVEQVSDPDLGGANTIGTADRTKSKFIIAEGGVVLE
ncbi:MAG: hypothetical protein IJZ67_05285 [Alistipes sp.]|nr:hypothetical protein [Alistipes sp.]